MLVLVRHIEKSAISQTRHQQKSSEQDTLHAIATRAPKIASFPHLSSVSEGQSESVVGQWHLHRLLNKGRELEGSVILRATAFLPQHLHLQST